MKFTSRCPAAAPVLLSLAGVLSAGPALAVEMPEARAQLVSAGGADGAYRLGLALDLPKGWHTYWRNPGDAGIPPAFDFSGSGNLRSARVDYPAPERLDDGVSVSMVYEGRVVFPIGVDAADPSKPVAFRVRLAYGLCRDVCVPAETTLDLSLAPGRTADAAAARAIAPFAARVPRRLDDGGAGRLDVLAARFDPAAAKGELTVAVPADGLADLFVTVAPPWYAAPPAPVGKDGDRQLYRIALEAPAGAKGLAGTVLTFTEVGAGGAYEFDRRLD